jgi:trk system potassium uptake protein TrkA
MHRAAVIGLGRFGTTLAREMARYGTEVIAIDTDVDHVDEVRDVVTMAVVADGSDEKTLRDLGVAGVDVAVVSMGDNFEGMQLAVLLLKRRLGVPRVVAKATSPLREHILQRIGCDEVVSPERESAIRLAHHLVLPRILEQVALGPNHCLVQLVAPPSMVGKELREIDTRNRFGVNIVAIKRRVGMDGNPLPTGDQTAALSVSSLSRGSSSRGSANGAGLLAQVGACGDGVQEQVKVVPMPTDRILEGDVLVVIGEDAGIARMVE